MKYKVCLRGGDDMFELSCHECMIAARRDLAVCSRLLKFLAPGSSASILIVMEDDVV